MSVINCFDTDVIKLRM